MASLSFLIMEAKSLASREAMQPNGHTIGKSKGAGEIKPRSSPVKEKNKKSSSHVKEKKKKKKQCLKPEPCFPSPAPPQRGLVRDTINQNPNAVKGIRSLKVAIIKAKAEGNAITRERQQKERPKSKRRRSRHSRSRNPKTNPCQKGNNGSGHFSIASTVLIANMSKAAISSSHKSTADRKTRSRISDDASLIPPQRPRRFGSSSHTKRNSSPSVSPTTSLCRPFLGSSQKVAPAIIESNANTSNDSDDGGAKAYVALTKDDAATNKGACHPKIESISFKLGDDLSLVDDFSDVWSMDDKAQEKAKDVEECRQEQRHPTGPKPESKRSRCGNSYILRPPQRRDSLPRANDEPGDEKEPSQESNDTAKTAMAASSSNCLLSESRKESFVYYHDDADEQNDGNASRREEESIYEEIIEEIIDEDEATSVAASSVYSKQQDNDIDNDGEPFHHHLEITSHHADNIEAIQSMVDDGGNTSDNLWHADAMCSQKYEYYDGHDKMGRQGQELEQYDEETIEDETIEEEVFDEESFDEVEYDDDDDDVVVVVDDDDDDYDEEEFIILPVPQKVMSEITIESVLGIHHNSTSQITIESMRKLDSLQNFATDLSK